MTEDIVNILLVEDNQSHAELIKRCFKIQNIANRIYHCIDGAEAIDYLFRRNKYVTPESSPRPQLILLDLNLPKIDGHGVLDEIEKSKDLSRIPIVVLTTSEAPQDIKDAYAHCVNSYVVKPFDYVEFTKLMNVLSYYWLGSNRQPVQTVANDDELNDKG